MFFETLLAALALLASATIPVVFLWRRKRPGGGLIGWCLLAGLLMCAAFWMANNHPKLNNLAVWQSTLIRWSTIVLAPALAVACIARLLSQPTGPLRILLNVLAALGLALLLALQMFFTSLWDVSTDGIGALYLRWVVSLAALLSALALLFRAPGARKAWALVILAGFPLLMNASTRLANNPPGQEWGRMPAAMTERGAAIIDDALQRYRDRQGGYPARLSDLTPRELLLLPRQYILPGWEWCYAGDAGGFRFGYVYREYFSSPREVKIFSEAGAPPAQAWNCPLEEVNDGLAP